MRRKTIDPQPIIEKLATRCLKAKGVECSILGEVIDMLRTAPDDGAGTSFALVDDLHVNYDQIRSFTWRNGELCVWYAGRHYFEHWEDPEKKLYKELCYKIGVLPAEDRKGQSV